MSQDINNNYEVNLDDINKASTRLLKKCDEIITPSEALILSLKHSKKAIIKMVSKNIKTEEICKLFNAEFYDVIKTECKVADLQEFIDENMKPPRRKTKKI